MLQTARKAPVALSVWDPCDAVALVMFVAKTIIIFGFDRNYTIITQQSIARNVITDRKLRLRQTSKPDNLY